MSTVHSTVPSMGGALSKAVDAVAASGRQTLSVSDAGTKEAFLDSWTRKLTDHARYLRSRGEELLAPVVLVHVDNSSETGRKLNWLRRPMFGGAYTDPLAGALAIGTAEVGGYVKPDRLSDTESITIAIEQAGLEDRLTIALMSTSQLIIWSDGLGSDTCPFQRDLDDNPIVMDLDDLDRNLSQFYEVAARQSRTLWKERDKRITVENPESTVQQQLWLFLLGKYADRATVKLETVIGHGRADITLNPTLLHDASAVLELKVTRDVRTPNLGTTTLTPISLKENLEWVRSGVQQTAAYRDDAQFNGAFLCVYDFCAGKLQAIEDAINVAAAPYDVRARRYWITASHEEHRQDRYPLPQLDTGNTNTNAPEKATKRATTAKG